MGKAGQALLAGLDSLNHFCGLWTTGAIPTCLVLGPGVIRAGAIIGLVQESQIKEVVGGKGFGLAGLHMRGMPSTSCLLSLEISQPWEELSLHDQQGP